MNNIIKHAIINIAVGTTIGMGIGAIIIIFDAFVTWDFRITQVSATVFRFFTAIGAVVGVWVGVSIAIKEQSNDD